jgi:4'-phosphopantetheinyl transferase EntD
VARDSILSGLFGDGVITEEVDLLTDPLGELLPEERATIPRAGSARLLEFRAGRHCARAALERLGLSGSPVLRAADRAPIWPTGYVGAIAHTRAKDRGWCGAAVARASTVTALGLDAEIDEPLEHKLWERVLTPAERAFILGHPEHEQGFLAKLVFSAKECTYKCQYPRSLQFLEFADVEVTLASESATFSAALLRSAPPWGTGQNFAGRYVRKSGVIATAVTFR